MLQVAWLFIQFFLYREPIIPVSAAHPGSESMETSVPKLRSGMGIYIVSFSENSKNTIQIWVVANGA